MNTIWKRLTSESPTFFKRIQAIGITLGAVGAAIMAIPSEVLILPEFLTKLASYFVVAGIIAAAIAKTTVADSTVLEKKDEAK